MGARSWITTTVIGAVTVFTTARSFQGTGRPADARRGGRTDTLYVRELRETAAKAGPDTAGFETGLHLLATYAAAGDPVQRLDVRSCPRDSLRLGHRLVVILPDPAESHLDWGFDAGVESVRRAFERSGYVLDRFWLPWGDADSTKRVTGARRLAARRPGVLVFRGIGARQDSVAIAYVVGEIPTRGVHSEALRAALEDRRLVGRCWSGLGTRPVADTARDSTRRAQTDTAPATLDTARDLVRIVGPIFSGSASSLRNALYHWHAAHATDSVEVVSGGATDPSIASQLRSCPDTTTGKCDRWLQFAATVHPLDDLKGTVEELLTRALDVRRSEIAYLTESGTQYGRAYACEPLADSGRAERGRPDSARRAAPCTAQGRDSSPAAAAATDTLPLTIPVPMNISRLRREYRRETAPADTQFQRLAPARTRLEWSDPASSFESPAPFSELTAAMIERTVDDIEQTLRLHHIRAVGIVMTDVRDRLFLASVVREQLRDVRIFFIGSHSLYLRPELNEALRGSLVVSTYPLFLENQFWDLTHVTDRQRFVFTSDQSEGTYNATLDQLGHLAEAIDYGMPIDAGTGAKRPPVWVTVVGAHSMLPVFASRHMATSPSSGSYLRVREVTSTRSAAEPSAATTEQTLLTVMLIAGFLIALVLHSSDSARGILRMREALPEGMRRRLGDRGGARADVRRGLAADPEWEGYHVALMQHEQSWSAFRLVAISCGVCALALILFRPRLHGGTTSGWGLTALLVLIVIALVADLSAFQLRSAGLRRGTGVRGMARYVALLSLALLYLLAMIDLTIKVASLHPDEASQFFLRALELDSGVTPVVPLLVGAGLLAVWCTWHLKRIRLLAQLPTFEAACRTGRIAGVLEAPADDDQAHHSDAPAARPATGSAAGLSQPVWQIRRGLLEMVPSSEGWGLLIALMLLGLWVIGHFDRSIESAVPHMNIVPGGTTATRLDVIILVLLALGVAFAAWRAGGLFREQIRARRYLSVAVVSAVVLVVAGLIAVRPLRHVIGTWGGVPSAFDLLLRGLILASIALAVWGLHRLLVVWVAFRRWLRNVDALPLGTAFARLPADVAALARFSPFVAPPVDSVRLVLDRAALARWLRLAHAALPPSRAGDVARIAAAEIAAGRSRQVALRSVDAWFDTSATAAVETLHAAVLEAARTGGPEVFETLTRAAAPAKAESGASGERADVGARHKGPPRQPPPALSWAPTAQELYALYVVDYVEWVVRHLRDLAFYLVMSLALTTVLLSSYPFSPESVLKVLFFATMGISVLAIGVILFQMNRNVALSRITQTTPGEVTWDTQFVLNLLLVGGVPLLAALSAEFPQIRNFLFSWVTPALKMIGKG